jgi:para-aminobenzoate synthetase component I
LTAIPLTTIFPQTSLLSASEPLIRRLPSEFTSEYCFRRLSRLPGCVWLDSSLPMETLGRYSYMAADPFCMLRVDKPQGGALETMANLLSKYRTPRLPGLPPMQGGVMGWFGYELGGCFERLPSARYNEFHLPLAVLGLYDVVLAWDHVTDEGWLVSQGLPVLDPQMRSRRAYRRMQYFLRMLEAIDDPTSTALVSSKYPLPQAHLAPQFPTRWSHAWTSNFSSSDFRRAVARAVEYVHAGDIFQVNIAQRLIRQATCQARELYLHLRSENPVPFGGYADFGRTQVVSSSPERFIQLSGREIETRPIKGTRPRLSDPAADRAMGQLLLQSDKDRAENVMIVDLLRNDLSRVADVDSMQVTSLCELEAYRYVWHLVSVIRARLATSYSASDLLRATFPGGSITGAPKIRAMEIIAELEPTARGPYCGSLGYLSFAGDMDLSILIRTLTACDGWWQVPVGGGIVAASDPVLEEQETWHKAEGVLRAIESLKSSS